MDRITRLGWQLGKKGKKGQDIFLNEYTFAFLKIFLFGMLILCEIVPPPPPSFVIISM